MILRLPAQAARQSQKLVRLPVILEKERAVKHAAHKRRAAGSVVEFVGQRTIRGKRCRTGAILRTGIRVDVVQHRNICIQRRKTEAAVKPGAA